MRCKAGDRTRMVTNAVKARLMSVALFALSGVAFAQTGGKPTEGKPAATDAKASGVDAKSSAAASAMKEKARKATSIAELRKLYEEASKQRDLIIADFETLAKQMKDATEEQKKEIKEKMEQQWKAFEEVTNALHKQIRDEQRKQRQGAGPGRR